VKKLLLGIAFSATLLTGLAQADAPSVLDRAAKNAIAERIKPTGTVCVQGQECSGASAATSGQTGQAAVAATRSGADIYNKTCTTCHSPATASALGAPEFGKADGWQARLDQGFDTMMDHAINGLGAMPPKGTCNDCTDEELMLAVKYMVKESTGQDVGPAIEPAKATETEEAEQPAPAEEVEAVEEEAAEEVAGRSGEEIYNASCVACHGPATAALLGAPALGSNEDWAPRVEQGFDTLVEHSLQGLNAMPPKGTCGDCTDAEMANTVQYMLDQLN